MIIEIKMRAKELTVKVLCFVLNPKEDKSFLEKW